MKKLKQTERYVLYKPSDKFGDFLEKVAAVDLLDYLRNFVIFVENFYKNTRQRVNWLLSRLDGKAVLGCASSAEADADLSDSEVNIYVNEGTNNLTFKVKYSDGTVKSGTVALS